jgi:cytosine deaminase
MGLDHLGLEVGKTASLVMLDAGDPIEAIRLRAERLYVIAKGKMVAEREKRLTRLALDGRPTTVERRHEFPATPA